MNPNAILRANFDGAFAAGWMAIGAQIRNADSKVVKEVSSLVHSGIESCNVAEYMALLEVLRYASEQSGLKRLYVAGDSRLIINQVEGRWKCNHLHLLGFRDEARRLIEQIQRRSVVQLQWIPRRNNAKADELAGQAIKSAPVREALMPRLIKKGSR
jgi:ribonuclease HI